MRFFLHFILVITLAINGYSQNSWQQLNDLPSEEVVLYAPFEPGLGWAHHLPAFAIGEYGYLLDWSVALGFQNRMMRYDPSNDEWTELENSVFPEGKQTLSYAIAYDGYGYFTFRGDTPSTQRLWRFDPVALSWEELDACPCMGRGHPALAASNGKIYMGLGQASNNLNDWWAYNIDTNSWEEKQSFPGAERHHPYFFEIGTDIYVGMGHGVDIYNDLYKYEPSLDQWTEMSPLPAEGRVAGTEFSYNGKGYVLSGEGEDHYYLEEAEFWEYDPDLNTWTQLESQPGTGRWAPGSFLIDSTVYYFGGQYDTGQQAVFTDANGNTITTPIIYDNELWSYTFADDLSFIEEDSFIDESIMIFPNPTKEIVNIQSPITIHKIELFNVSGGRVLYRENLNLKEIQLDLTLLLTGVYKCIIYTESKVSIKKVVVK